MSTSTDIKNLSTAELAQAAKLLKERQKRERAAAKEKRRQYDLLRDDYLDTVFGRMAELSELLREFKGHSVKLGLELHAKMYEAYGREPKEGIDNYTLTNTDGDKKVVIERQYRCEYDETAEVAIAEIKDVLRAKFAARNKAVYDMLERVLLRNNKGDYDERLVAKLRAEESAVNDQRFSAALDMLAKAYKPKGSQTYIRAYRKDATGKWIEVTMNWSRM